MYKEVQGNPWCLFVLVHALLILGLKYTYLCNLSWRFILGLHNVSGNEFINKNIKMRNLILETQGIYQMFKSIKADVQNIWLAFVS